MKSKRFVCLFALLLSFFHAVAQEDFADVTKEDLLATTNPIDPSAKAAILNSHKYVYFTFTQSGVELVTEVKKRIKFYDSVEAFEHATQHVYLYEDSDAERISKIRGHTYNLKGGEIEKTKLKNEGIFEKQLNKNLKEVSFTLPAVKEGSIIEFEYEVTSPFFWDIDEFVFQYDIPVMHASAKIHTPNNFLFNRIFKGAEIINESHEEKKDQRIGRLVDVYSYQVENVSALKDEKYVDNIKNYRSGVIFELTFIHFLNGEKKRFSVSWEDVAKTLAESDDYGRKMKSTGVFKDDLEALIASKTDTLQMVKDILNHVKANIKWNGIYGKYFYNGMRKAYKEHKGNSADVNLTLVSMLREAGIRSYPVAISTRENLKPFFPSMDQLNYVIALAVIDGKAYYMDATESYSKLNLLPIRDYNWKGLMVDTEKWRLVDLSEPPQSEMIRMLNAKIAPDFSISGKVRSKLSNHYAYLFRKKINSKSKEDFIRNKETNLDNIVITDYEAEHKKGNLDEVKENYSYKYENAAEVVGTKLFFSPLFFFVDDENPFKSESRKYPINLGYPFKDKTLVNIQIPEGYAIASLPKPINLNLAKGLGMFKYLVSNNGNFISVSMEFEITQATINPDQYEYLKNFYDTMIQKQMENIVLKKT